MNDKQAARWEKRRRKGRNYYMLVHGVLKWGLSLTILFTLLEYGVQKSFTLPLILTRLIEFSVLGIIVAGFSWNISERKLSERNQSK